MRRNIWKIKKNQPMPLIYIFIQVTKSNPSGEWWHSPFKIVANYLYNVHSQIEWETYFPSIIELLPNIIFKGKLAFWGLEKKVKPQCEFKIKIWN